MRVHADKRNMQKLSTISQQISQKLSSFLRESLGVLYIGVPTSTLQLAAAIFESVYHNRILSALGGTPGDQKELWESVLYALLSGVLVRLLHACVRSRTDTD